VTDPHATEQPEYPSPSIVDSRRLPGPNLYSGRTGAVLEVAVGDADAHRLIAAWRQQVSDLVQALDWGACEAHVRLGRGGASLFVAAPVDALMTATEVNEQAWVAAESDADDLTDVVARLAAAAEIERASRPHLEGAHAAAVGRGLVVTFDDDALTIGAGAGAQTWALADIPPPDAIPWSALHDIPIALVTGSNGKTTTTRLLAAMWRAQGVVTGWSCSDGVWVGDERLESGDYSGPSGARTVLRDARAHAAVLETARGGILRRGLAVTRADAAIITNISADHFGEYGIDTLRELADVKGVVARAVGERGCLVLNADDPLLVDLGTRVRTRIAWFSAVEGNGAVGAHVACGGDATWARGGRVFLHRNATTHDLGAVDDMPITLRGAAPHNIENILGAALLASVAGVDVECIRATLASFGTTPADNPGRLQVYELGGVTLLTDYAHNPGGLAALCRTATSFPAMRRLLVLGQAGNRDDEQLRELVRAAWGVTSFDRVIVKEMPALLRGRAEGAIPAVFVDEVVRMGAARENVEIVMGDLAAVRRALTWARAGDVLVCPIHTEKDAVLSWLGRVLETGWTPGQPLPQ
jgi:UDP-N-acetylmuramyl tripeptide synthase